MTKDTDIEIIDNVVDDNFSDYLIHRIRLSNHWRIDPEYGKEDHIGRPYSEHPADDTGMTLPIYRIDEPQYQENDEAKEILALSHYATTQFFFRSKFAFVNPVIHRVYYNLYSSTGRGLLHRDMPHTNKTHHSFVYNMNTCDGGTIFECPDAIEKLGTNIVPSVAGRFLAFPSELYEHYGSTSGKDKQRFTLNVIWSYDERVLKT